MAIAAWVEQVFYIQNQQQTDDLHFLLFVYNEIRVTLLVNSFKRKIIRIYCIEYEILTRRDHMQIVKLLTAATIAAAMTLTVTGCSSTAEMSEPDPVMVNCYIGNAAPVRMTAEECSARGGNTTRG